MALSLVGRQPYMRVLTYENLLDETGREMHKSWGNAIELNEALDRMGADVMRWLYCEQNPAQELRFGYSLADDVKRRLLTFWNSVSFFATYANIAEFDPSTPASELRPLDRWLASRTSAFVTEATEHYERYWTPGIIASFERFVDDLSNWYIRRTRRRFWDGDQAALHALWEALGAALQVIAPVMPFLADYLWRNLVSTDKSLFLERWPEPGEVDERLNADVGAVRQIVELGRQARATSGLKFRQPLRRVVVEGADGARSYADEIAEELRVKEVEFGNVEASELRVKPNLPVLGPKLGAALRDVREALARGEFEELDGGRFRVGEHELSPDEVLVERAGKEGWAVASANGFTVALDTALDSELELEAAVLDLIHQLNAMRKEQGLELTDRIRIKLPAALSELLRHEDWIKQETLAIEIEIDGDIAEPQISKA
jgi:isoleucyl-tRNA synthetase